MTRVEHSIEEVQALGGYKIIYADPAWKYRNSGRGAADRQYETIVDAQMAALPVSQIAARDSVMFMWGTWPCLPVCLATLGAWGFEYKTLGFIWFKTNVVAGTPKWCGGFWTRSNTEFCLVGVRGDLRRIDAGVHQIVETWDEIPDTTLRSPTREHSEKPPEVRDRIVQLMGDLPRIELFSRCRVPGWDAFGNDARLGGSDIRLASGDCKNILTSIEDVE